MKLSVHVPFIYANSLDAQRSSRNGKARLTQIIRPSIFGSVTINLPVSNMFQVSGVRIRDFIYDEPCSQFIALHTGTTMQWVSSSGHVSVAYYMEEIDRSNITPNRDSFVLRDEMPQ